MRPRRRLACHHEAGHCLARWFLGFGTDYVEVLSVDQIMAGATIEDRNGQEVACEGLCSGYDIGFPRCAAPPADADHEVRELWRARGEYRAQLALMVALAGVAAEMSFRRCSGLICAVGGGESDYADARSICADWFDESMHKTLLRHASRQATALVRSVRGRAAIAAIVEPLWRCGRLDGDGIRTACETAFDASPPFDAWRDAWPPSLTQIRSGVLPLATAPPGRRWWPVRLIHQPA